MRAVLLNCVDPDLDLPAVLPDDVAGGRMAVEHLVSAGVTGDDLRRRRGPDPGGDRRP